MSAHNCSSSAENCRSSAENCRSSYHRLLRTVDRLLRNADRLLRIRYRFWGHKRLSTCNLYNCRYIMAFYSTEQNWWISNRALNLICWKRKCARSRIKLSILLVGCMLFLIDMIQNLRDTYQWVMYIMFLYYSSIFYIYLLF